ncbi:peptidase domain-containing ABC transporter [Geothrix sp. PMB-07]|uniref:peptidase domain-containing ABC transporter n=1 Tax=Geothrix sp. PMB-07 TaxID=3068640 RepID=UPI002740B303|nr:ATP-binding cassette domain-containing protein [Geothrix sp. PMB-07]WLT33475.1 ATP-binding cassette domain-containing protein [Geothrix sp. PMB-07]
MSERMPLVGIPGNLALWRLLSLKGIEVSLQALEETLLWEFSLENLVQELQVRGFEARGITIQEQDLHHLELPTLAQLTNGSWILLRKRVARGYLVEQGMGGLQLAPLGRLSQDLAGPAIDISEPLAPTGSLWSRMGNLLPRHRRVLGQVAMITLVGQGLALLPPWLTGKLVDLSLSRGVPSLLSILCLGLLLASLFQAWVGWLREVSLLAFTTPFEATLEKGLCEHLLALPFKYLQSKTLGQLLQTFSGLRRARSLLLDQGLGALFSGVAAVFYLAYMALVMPGPAAVVLAGAMAISALAFGVGFLQAREQQQEVKAAQAENSALLELLTGATTLKATASQSWAFKRWAKRLRLQLHHGLRRERHGLWTEGGNILLNEGLLAGVLIWGGQRVLAGELSLGSLLVFVQLSGAFTAALLALAQTGVTFLALRPQLEAVQETFAETRSPKLPRRGPKDLSGPIKADEVWFRYAPEAPWVLQGARLLVQPGTFHQVKGASGSGKSTLLKLLAGLYAPEAGNISIGGLDTFSASSLTAFLPQFPGLSSGSILENLKLFSAGANQSHLMKVAKQTGLDAWVGTLPMGYQTMVASGGENLSGGQRQLVAITAILASDRPLLLLDEALSNLDWISRNRIIHSPFLAGRTVIYASHEELLSESGNHHDGSSPIPTCSETP